MFNFIFKWNCRGLKICNLREVEKLFGLLFFKVIKNIFFVRYFEEVCRL